MYLITPYESVEGLKGKLNLNSTPDEIEKSFGKCDLKSNEYAPNYLTGSYPDGLTISYKENLVCYIGILITSSPVHHNFYFIDKNYDELMNYFKQYPGNIYIENDVGIVSEFLGISAYFEDGLKEVAIFSKSYGEEIIKTLEIAT